MPARTEDDTETARGGILEENRIGAIWQICFIANSFTFPIYALFDRQHDISRMEFVVLYVAAHRTDIMAWEICRMTGLPKNNISRGVQKLQQKGLITRSTDPADARRSFLNLTTSGGKLFQDLAGHYVDRAEGFLSLLDDADRMALEDITLRLSRKVVASDLV